MDHITWNFKVFDKRQQREFFFCITYTTYDTTVFPPSQTVMAVQQCVVCPPLDYSADLGVTGQKMLRLLGIWG